MKKQRGPGIHAQIGETGRHRGFLQVARQVYIQRKLLRVGQRAQIARQLSERRAAIARLNRDDCRTQLRRIVDHLRQRLIARLQRTQHFQRFVLGLLQPIPRPHTERAIDRDDGDLLSIGGADGAAYKGIREQQGE